MRIRGVYRPGGMCPHRPFTRVVCANLICLRPFESPLLSRLLSITVTESRHSKILIAPPPPFVFRHQGVTAESRVVPTFWRHGGTIGGVVLLHCHAIYTFCGPVTVWPKQH